MKIKLFFIDRDSVLFDKATIETCSDPSISNESLFSHSFINEPQLMSLLQSFQQLGAKLVVCTAGGTDAEHDPAMRLANLHQRPFDGYITGTKVDATTHITQASGMWQEVTIHLDDGSSTQEKVALPIDFVNELNKQQKSFVQGILERFISPMSKDNFELFSQEVQGYFSEAGKETNAAGGKFLIKQKLDENATVTLAYGNTKITIRLKPFIQSLLTMDEGYDLNKFFLAFKEYDSRKISVNWDKSLLEKFGLSIETPDNYQKIQPNEIMFLDDVPLFLALFKTFGCHVIIADTQDALGKNYNPKEHDTYLEKMRNELGSFIEFICGSLENIVAVMEKSRNLSQPPRERSLLTILQDFITKADSLKSKKDVQAANLIYKNVALVCGYLENSGPENKERLLSLKKQCIDKFETKGTSAFLSQTPYHELEPQFKLLRNNAVGRDNCFIQDTLFILSVFKKNAPSLFQSTRSIISFSIFKSQPSDELNNLKKKLKEAIISQVKNYGNEEIENKINESLKILKTNMEKTQLNEIGKLVEDLRTELFTALRTTQVAEPNPESNPNAPQASPPAPPR